jgi:hypothetical protein
MRERRRKGAGKLSGNFLQPLFLRGTTGLLGQEDSNGAASGRRRLLLLLPMFLLLGKLEARPKN